MEGHAQKCLQRHCELGNQTIDEFHKVSTPLLGRSPNRTRRSGNCERVVGDLLSDRVEMLVLGENWKTRSTLDN